MKSRVVVLLVGLTCAILGQRAAAQQEFEKLIAGKWDADIAKTKEFLKERSIPIENEAFFDEAGSLSIEFATDGTLTVREAGTESMRGEWKFVKEESTVFHLQFIREEEATPATIEFINDDSIAVAPQNEQPLVLTRATSKPLAGLTSKLVGTWKQDPEASKSVESNKSFSQEEIDRMLADTDGMVITFNADKTLVAKMKDSEAPEIKANWLASNVDETKKSLRIDVTGENVERVVQAVFLDDHRICFTPEGEPGAVFTRQPPEREK